VTLSQGIEDIIYSFINHEQNVNISM